MTFIIKLLFSNCHQKTKSNEMHYLKHLRELNNKGKFGDRLKKLYPYWFLALASNFFLSLWPPTLGPRLHLWKSSLKTEQFALC